MFYLSVLCGCEEFSEGTFLSICVIKNHLVVIEPVTAGIVRSDIEREENGGIIWPWERGCFDCDSSWQTRSVAVFLNDCLESA